MNTCKSIGCRHPVLDADFCAECTDLVKPGDGFLQSLPVTRPLRPVPAAPDGSAAAGQAEYTGRSVSYYQVSIDDPMSGGDAYLAECGDIIEALGMDYNEGNAFKAIWRKCAARTLGKKKKGYTDGLYDSEKTAHYGERMVAVEKRQRSKQAETETTE